MDIRNLAWKNLRRRKTRAVFTGLGIFLGIGTFVALSTLTSRMEGAIQDKLDRFGANILVAPRAEEVRLGFGNISLGGTQVARAKLSGDDRDRIGSIPMRDRLARVVPYLLHAADASGKEMVWMGLPSRDLSGARPWWRVRGSLPGSGDEVLLGSEASAALDKGPGGTVSSGKRTFRVAGVLAPTGEKEDSMVIGDLRTVQELAGTPGAVSYIEVAAHCKDCPVDEIVAEISGAVPGAKVTAIRQVVESRREAVDQFRKLGIGVTAIVLAIAGLVVFVTVMGNVQERTREIGVLRAVGFRRRAILSLLFWETGWIAFFSSALGVVAGVSVSLLSGPLFGVEGAGFSPGIAAVGLAAGTALGLLGSVPPSRKAAALCPTEAIRSL
jgi:putative ABC transport system permease protein